MALRFEQILTDGVAECSYLLGDDATHIPQFTQGLSVVDSAVGEISHWLPPPAIKQLVLQHLLTFFV